MRTWRSTDSTVHYYGLHRTLCSSKEDGCLAAPAPLPRHGSHGYLSRMLNERLKVVRNTKCWTTKATTADDIEEITCVGTGTKYWGTRYIIFNIITPKSTYKYDQYDFFARGNHLRYVIRQRNSKQRIDLSQPVAPFVVIQNLSGKYSFAFAPFPFRICGVEGSA